MKRRLAVGLMAGCLAASLWGCGPKTDLDEKMDISPEISSEISSDAFHRALLTIDSHVDIPLNYMSEIDPGKGTDLQVDLDKLTAGGLDAAFFIIYTPQGGETQADFIKAAAIAETRITAIETMLAQYDERIALATTPEQIVRINESGKLVAIIGMENAYPLANNIDKVADWAARGVRYVGITHFGHNHFADSSNPHAERDGDKPRHSGLSSEGRALIAALNDHAIMVDVSHASKETMMQAADLSRTPIIASHSGAKAVGDNPRNLDDEQLRKIAEVGGVAQMVAFDGYVKPFTAAQKDFQKSLREEMGLASSAQWQAASDAVKSAYRKRRAAMWEIEPRASLADFIDHIDHAVKIAGIDHVGIASDFDGGGGLDGWEDASQTANVTAALIERGYSKDDITKIWSGNLLRIMEAAKAGAKK